NAEAKLTVTYLSIGDFTPPVKGMGWNDADAYCKGLTPPGRLPTAFELQSLFINSTSATAIDQTNYEMCNTYGWPLYNKCGGGTNWYWTIQNTTTSQTTHYIVSMLSGSSKANLSSDSDPLNTTCIH
uniref:DUF1566 domain-containing protein n=2 Tax=Aeromonas sobria TaxID=646 RepID=UPI001CBA64CD